MRENQHSARAKPLVWRCGRRVFDLSQHPLIMGIINVTPDSFSDGGKFFDEERAVAHGLRLAQDGADILDVGGESTRPGAAPVPEDEELRRTIPVIRRLRDTGAALSIDTRKGRVAREALAEGAEIVNDVTALMDDPETAEAARQAGAGVILMHMRGNPRTMQNQPEYADVAAEVRDYLRARLGEAASRGLASETLAVDPGIGFGKTLQHNLELLGRLPWLTALGRPVVVGLSRKSFLGKLTGREVGDRLAASIAGLAFSVLQGATIMRVHDVRESWDAVRVLTALAREKRG